MTTDAEIFITIFGYLITFTLGAITAVIWLKGKQPKQSRQTDRMRIAIANSIAGFERMVAFCEKYSVIEGAKDSVKIVAALGVKETQKLQADYEECDFDERQRFEIDRVQEELKSFLQDGK